MESAFDVSTQCVNFHWTPASRWTLAALALLWAAFHALFAYRRSWQSHGFLEGHERVCVGLRLLSNLLWYALLVENMAKLHTRQDTADSQQPPAAAAAADAAYTPSLALSGLGHVLRFQATVGLLLALVSHGGASGGGGLMGQRRCSADVLDEGLRPCGLSRICRHPQLFGSACGGWILNVYALVHYTRDLLLKQALLATPDFESEQETMPTVPNNEATDRSRGCLLARTLRQHSHPWRHGPRTRSIAGSSAAAHKDVYT
eukprot:TRINITY_DN19011_c0_g1_i2.p1 TRINITY_DN19011_c0_g1~~TRINITY_DN19011_c0_g1_i2.p1  ORF type:complete len:260 (+),score=40.01 TRINITY_DN19011_c0_g1_i2:70-849(+)